MRVPPGLHSEACFGFKVDNVLLPGLLGIFFATAPVPVGESV